jgi:hypothetical protein
VAQNIRVDKGGDQQSVGDVDEDDAQDQQASGRFTK